MSQKMFAPGKKQAASEGGLPPLPDRRAMEGVIADMFGGRSKKPVDLAQDIMDDAWGCPSRIRRIELAHKAMETSQDCADAYVLLAEEAATLEEATELYRKGTEAGERAIGKRAFREDVGHF